MIPVYEPIFTEDDAQAAANAVRSGILSAFGPEVRKLEDSFAGYIGSQYALSCSSGTAGLYLALSQFIKPDDIVAVPTCSYAATAFSVMHHNARIEFIDCDLDTWNLDLNALEEACKKKRIKAVIAVHNYGNPIDMHRLMRLSDKYGFVVVEDACEALTSTHGGKAIGSIGHIGVFSFYGNKLLSVTGDTPIYIKKNGLAKIISAKELDVMPTDNLECASFSPTDGTIDWAPVSNIVSHDYDGDIIRIGLEYNKHVDVTANHNLFVLRNGNIVDLPTSQLIRGDYVICPKKIPYSDSVKQIDILDYLPHSSLWRYSYHDNESILKLHNIMSSREIERKFRIPRLILKKMAFNRDCKYPKYDKELSTATQLIVEQKKQVRGGFRTPVDRFINITSEFCRLLGYYVAEGSSSSSGITFCFHINERTYQNDVRELFSNVFKHATAVNDRLDSNSSLVTCGGLIQKKLFTTLCGRGAKNKHIPNFIFNSTKECRLEFLRGYWNGDGCKRDTNKKKSKHKIYVEFKTVSKQLATELQYLLLTLGCVSAIEYDKARSTFINGRACNTSRSYKVRVSDNKFINMISGSKLPSNYVGQKADMVPAEQFKFKTGHERVNQSSVNAPFLNKDLCFLQIKSIKKIKTGINRVYDLCVPTRFENFVAGYGGICVHNSSGEGGMVVTNNRMYHDHMKLERGQGQDPDRRFWHLIPGSNFRLTNVQAALVNSQFSRIDSIIARKLAIYERYRDHLDDSLIWQQVPYHGKHCYWMVSIRHWEAGWYGRAQQHMTLNGIETRPIFPPIHTMPACSDYSSVVCPNAEHIYDTGITLPSGPGLADAQIDKICATINQIA
jgi:dTDP-4-amino-4,6-dideoxygalactose transaminase